MENHIISSHEESPTFMQQPASKMFTWNVSSVYLTYIACRYLQVENNKDSCQSRRAVNLVRHTSCKMLVR